MQFSLVISKVMGVSLFPEIFNILMTLDLTFLRATGLDTKDDEFKK